MSNKLVFPERPTYNSESVVSDHGIGYVAMVADQFTTERALIKKLEQNVGIWEQSYKAASASMKSSTEEYNNAVKGWAESEKKIACLDAENRKLQDSLKFSRDVNVALNKKLIAIETQRDILIRAIDKVK